MKVVYKTIERSILAAQREAERLNREIAHIELNDADLADLRTYLSLSMYAYPARFPLKEHYAIGEHVGHMFGVELRKA